MKTNLVMKEMWRNHNTWHRDDKLWEPPHVEGFFAISSALVLSLQITGNGCLHLGYHICPLLVSVCLSSCLVLDSVILRAIRIYDYLLLGTFLDSCDWLSRVKYTHVSLAINRDKVGVRLGDLVDVPVVVGLGNFVVGVVGQVSKRSIGSLFDIV